MKDVIIMMKKKNCRGYNYDYEVKRKTVVVKIIISTTKWRVEHRRFVSLFGSNPKQTTRGLFGLLRMGHRPVVSAILVLSLSLTKR